MEGIFYKIRAKNYLKLDVSIKDFNSIMLILRYVWLFVKYFIGILSPVATIEHRLLWFFVIFHSCSMASCNGANDRVAPESIMAVTSLFLTTARVSSPLSSSIGLELLLHLPEILMVSLRWCLLKSFFSLLLLRLLL